MKVDNQYEYTKLPTGKAIICACDQIYFDKFYLNLKNSFMENISAYDCLHVHIINPNSECIQTLSKENNEKLSFSWESSKNIRKINDIKISKSMLKSSLPRKIKAMLIEESMSGKPIFQKLMVLAYNAGLPWNYLISNNFLQKDQLRTYYALRRFIMPKTIFKNLTEILLIDIDSIFKKDFYTLSHDEHSVKAIKRSEVSWSNYYAGIVMVRLDKKGILFISRLSKILKSYLKKNIFFWGMDQLAIDECASLNLIQPLNSDLMNFKDNEEAKFISYKGDEKWK